MTFHQPSLFLSYARVDHQDADRIAQQLTGANCRVWLDRSELLVADDFVQGLARELARCDGLVCLLTKASAASSWCQAEVQRALALGLPVAVVRREVDAQFPDALVRLLRDTQALDWLGAEVPSLGAQIVRARRRRWIGLIRRSAPWVLTLMLAAMLASIAVWRMDRVEAAARRAEVVNRIATSSQMWSRRELDSVLAPAVADPALPPLLQNLDADATQPLAVRHNAWQALAALREGREREWRRLVPHIEWVDGRIRGAQWTNTSYLRGSVRGLEVERTTIAGIVLGPGPAEGKNGLTLLGMRIVDSDAWFLRIDATQLLDVEFRDVRFRGAQLDLSGHAGVRFVSTPANERMLTPAFTLIEDSWITQTRPPPDAHVMDLAEPELEILFDGVIFHRTHFDGHFKPQWFRNSRFESCVFATDLSREDLVAGGNQVEGSVWVSRDE
ncbi:MAG: toll/interleukin-1 receptor domain-containing protein [Pseudomarimonas sp.]